MSNNIEELIKLAKTARERAYVPYSKFQVGAALEGENGKIYSGCNIENASFGLTNCAERTAIFKAISENDNNFKIKKMAVVADTDEPVSPCGACRQVMAEFCTENSEITLTNLKGETWKGGIKDLLPGHFKATDFTNI